MIFQCFLQTDLFAFSNYTYLYIFNIYIFNMIIIPGAIRGAAERRLSRCCRFLCNLVWTLRKHCAESWGKTQHFYDAYPQPAVDNLVTLFWNHSSSVDNASGFESESRVFETSTGYGIFLFFWFMPLYQCHDSSTTDPKNDQHSKCKTDAIPVVVYLLYCFNTFKNIQMSLTHFKNVPN